MRHACAILRTVNSRRVKDGQNLPIEVAAEVVCRVSDPLVHRAAGTGRHCYRAGAMVVSTAAFSAATRDDEIAALVRLRYLGDRHARLRTSALQGNRCYDI